jgi:hypothetical protein
VSGADRVHHLTRVPAGWTVDSTENSWQSGQRIWIALSTVDAGATFTADATVTVLSNTSEDEYSIDATGHLTPDESDDTCATITGSEGFGPSNYDTDGDGSVEGDLQGVLQALADYNNGELNLTQALKVLAAFNG